MATYFEDWESHATGAQPTGWTKYGTNLGNNLYTVEDIGGAEGKVLRFTNTDNVLTSTRFNWEGAAGPGVVADVEVLARFRWINNASIVNHGLLVRSQQNADNSYEGGLDPDGVTAPDLRQKIRRNQTGNNGNLATLTETGLTDPSTAPSAWYWMRLRVNGTTLQLSVWPDSASEPAFEQNITDGAFADGYVGFTKFAYRSWECSQFSVGTAGDTAPMEAPSVPYNTLTGTGSNSDYFSTPHIAAHETGGADFALWGTNIRVASTPTTYANMWSKWGTTPADRYWRVGFGTDMSLLVDWCDGTTESSHGISQGTHGISVGDTFDCHVLYEPDFDGSTARIRTFVNGSLVDTHLPAIFTLPTAARELRNMRGFPGTAERLWQEDSVGAMIWDANANDWSTGTTWASSTTGETHTVVGAASIAEGDGVSATLTPDGDGTTTGFEDEAGGTTALFDSVASADDDATFIRNAGAANASAFFDLGATPSDFGSMNSLSVNVRLRRADEFVTDGLEALYLMEHERRNLLVYSEDFGNAAWSWTAGATLDPQGGYDVWAITDSNTGQQSSNRQDVTFAADQHVLAVSIYKHAGHQYPDIEVNVGATRYVVILDIGNGTATVAAEDSAPDDSGVLDDGDFWTVWMAFTVAAGEAGNVRVYPARRSAADGAKDAALTGTSYVQHAHWHTGSAPIPYVPTTNKQAMYDYSGNGRHMTRGSVGSAFICPVGEKHLFTPGTEDNNAVSSVNLGLTGDLDVRWEGTKEWSNTTAWTVLNEWDPGALRGWRLRIAGAAQATLRWYNSAGTATEAVLDGGNVPALTDWERITYRATLDVDDGAGNHVVRFYYRRAGDPSWTLLETETIAGTTDVRGGVGSNVTIGATSYNEVESQRGRTFSAQVWSGVEEAGGTLVADFNPDRDALGDVARFTSSTTGEVWTINQATAADTNDPAWSGAGLDGDGTDDYGVTNLALALTGATLQAAVTYQTAETSNSFIAMGDETSGDFLLTGTKGDSSVLGGSFQPAGTYVEVTGTEALPTGSPVMASIVWDGTTGDGQVYLNLTSSGSVTSLTGTFNMDRMALLALRRLGGASDPADAVAHVGAFYSRALTTAEREQNQRAAEQLLAGRGETL